MRRRWLVCLVGLLVIGAAATVVAWRPWQSRVGPAGVVEPDPPADTASLTILKHFDGPCQVEVRGTGGGASNLASASLAAGEARSIPLRFPAPYTVEAVTVTRDGNRRRREVKATLPGGRRDELLVNEDGTVAVAPAPR